MTLTIDGGSQVMANKGDGVHLVSLLEPLEAASDCRPDFSLPEGIFFDINGAEIHSNEQTGLYCQAGGLSPFTSFPSGSVGSGRGFATNGTTAYYNLGPLYPATDIDYVPGRGQGRLAWSAVHRNQERGVEVALGKEGVAAFRIVESMFWSNHLGGYYADMTLGEAGHALVTPITYSTFAGDGEGSNWVVETLLPLAVLPNFQEAGDSSGTVLAMKLIHSIFQRRVVGDPVFGPVLGGTPVLVPEDMGLLMQYWSPVNIYVVGCRSNSDHVGLKNQYGPWAWEDREVYWDGPSSGALYWNTADASDFFINQTPANSFHWQVSDVDGRIPYGPNEIFYDFVGDLRPIPSNVPSGMATAINSCRGAKTR